MLCTVNEDLAKAALAKIEEQAAEIDRLRKALAEATGETYSDGSLGRALLAKARADRGEPPWR